MCCLFSNSERLWFGGLFSGRTSCRLPKIVNINEHYFNINDESWRRNTAHRMYPCMSGGGRWARGDGHLSTTNNRAEVVAQRDGTCWRLNTLI